MRAMRRRRCRVRKPGAAGLSCAPPLWAALTGEVIDGHRWPHYSEPVIVPVGRGGYWWMFLEQDDEIVHAERDGDPVEIDRCAPLVWTQWVDTGVNLSAGEVLATMGLGQAERFARALLCLVAMARTG